MMNLFLTLIVISVTGCIAADQIPYEEYQLVPHIRLIRDVNSLADPKSGTAWKVEGALSYTTPEGIKFMTDFIANFLRSGAHTGHETEFIPAPQPFPNFHHFFTKTQHKEPCSDPSHYFAPTQQGDHDPRPFRVFQEPIRVADLPEPSVRYQPPSREYVPPTTRAPTTRYVPTTTRAPATKAPTPRYVPTTTRAPTTRYVPTTTRAPTTRYVPTTRAPTPRYVPTTTRAPTTRYVPPTTRAPTTRYVPTTTRALITRAPAPILPVAPAHTLNRQSPEPTPTPKPFVAQDPQPFKPSHAPLFKEYANQVTSTISYTQRPIVDSTQSSAKKPAPSSDEDYADDDDLPPPAALPPSAVLSLVG